MSDTIRFTYNADTHVTTCIRQGKYRRYTGIAKCHPQDWDFESKLVGEQYAYTRSVIAKLVAQRDEYKAQLKILKHLYSILKQNKNVNEKSTECYTIRRQIKLLERDLKEVKNLICDLKEILYNTIKGKDEFYAKVRKSREVEN